MCWASLFEIVLTSYRLTKLEVATFIEVTSAPFSRRHFIFFWKPPLLQKLRLVM